MGRVGPGGLRVEVLEELSSSSEFEDSDSEGSGMQFGEEHNQEKVMDNSSESSIKICSTRTLAPTTEILSDVQSDEDGWSSPLLESAVVCTGNNGGDGSQEVMMVVSEDLLKLKDQTIQDQANEIDALREENLTLETKLREAKTEIEKLKNEGEGTAQLVEVEKLKKELRISQLRERIWQRKFLEIKTDLRKIKDIQKVANELIEKRLTDLEKENLANDVESESDLESGSTPPEISHSRQSISPPIPTKDVKSSIFFKENTKNAKSNDTQSLYPRRSERIFLSGKVPASEVVGSIVEHDMEIGVPLPSPDTGIYTGPTPTLLKSTSSVMQTPSVQGNSSIPNATAADIRKSLRRLDGIDKFTVKNGKRFDCSDCPRKFYHENLYKKHINTHHPKKIIMKMKTSVKKTVRNKSRTGQAHEVDENKTDGFYCVCGADYRSIGALKYHIRYSLSEKKFSCPLPSCKKNFFTTTHLRIHMKQTHKMAYEKTNGCRDCGTTFENMKDLYSHIKITHNKGPWGRVAAMKRKVSRKRSVASKTTIIGSESFVESPRKWKHEKALIISEKDTLITEQIAAAALLSLRTDMVKPRKRNSTKVKDDMFLYDEESSNTSEDSSWWGNHDGQKRLSSEDSGSENTDLCISSPSQSFSGEHRQVSCIGEGEEVLLTFPNKPSIEGHILTKSGIKLFKCKICSKTFAKSKSLRHHLEKSHEMELPNGIIWCLKCGEEFENRRKLSGHRLEVHKERLTALNGGKAA